MTQEEFSKRYTYDVAVDRIGGGGFGTVYKAYDNVLHRDVAIKVSEVKTTADGKKTFSLKDEFEALSHVPKHPNIANYEEFYSFKMPVGIFDYAVMQYYPDGNLSNAIKEGMTDEQKEEVAMQLLEGIDFLHKHKVVHRDLKPGNILIVKHGGHIIPLITDFGLSKSAETGDGSQFSNSFGGGTQRYSSPEQLQGKPLRFNTDLWSYGAIVYELFMGEQLFSPGSGASNSAQAELEVYNKIIHGDVSKLGKMPERWRKVAERCMVVDPEKRVKSAEELIFLLKGYEEATVVEGMAVPQEQQQPQFQPQPVKPVAKPAAPKPVNNKPEPPKTGTSSGGKKKGKGLWIGLAAVAVIAVALVLLLKPKEETPVQNDPDTEAFLACQTVDDYRNYMLNKGRDSKHYAEAKHYVDSVVADSTAKAEELLAQQQAEADAKAKAEAEKEAFDKCTTIAACDKYLTAYPKGQYVEDVKAKKAELERQEANERAEAAAKELLEKQRQEDESFNNCTNLAACNKYLKEYPNGRYVNQVKVKKANFEAELAQQTPPNNNTNTNSNSSTSTTSSSTAKPGFSISSSKRVYFAPGNLQYHPYNNQWRIAPNPWDCIGEANKNISKNYNGWIDLFGWGNGDNPTNSSTSSSDYSNFTDWGSKMGKGYRTLKKAEWEYVFNKRSTPSGIRYAKAKVNGVSGVILLPDNWSKSTHSLNNTNDSGASFGGNSISATTWDNTFAPAGAVFLPAAGYRSGTSVNGGSYGYYWSASPYDSYNAYFVSFADGDLRADNWSHRSYGQSVRLARPAEN